MGSVQELPKSLQDSYNVSKAAYKRLGKSGLQVSIPILGAMSFGSEQWQPWVIEEDKVSLVEGGS
jgi:hypothetical protein